MRAANKWIRVGVAACVVILLPALARCAKPQAMSKEITPAKTYLLLPVNNRASQGRVILQVGGKVVREFGIQLGTTRDNNFWCFLDLRPFHKSKATLKAHGVSREAFESISQGDQVPGMGNLYREKHRQQFHFSSRRGWNNDPNGMVFYKGEYHLYYQHNPYAWKWGNMSWGHAVSKDLVHWKELPVAIHPFRFNDWVFSGSAAVDWNNTAGFQTGDEKVIVAAYTSTGRGESIAFSNDRGRTFTDFKGNPVVKHRGRDPKIIWYAPGKHWVMAVYDVRGKSKGIAFYTSSDLKSWAFASRIDGYHECPEIFELAVDGDKNNTKWVVYAANGHYAIGKFNGKTFTSETKKIPNNSGNCFYASQTFSDIPAQDGRRIQIAWGRIATPGMPFNQCMLFPCELTLRSTGEGVRMFTKPVKEIELLHKKKHTWRNLTVKGGPNPLSAVKGELFDIRTEFEVGAAGRVVLNLRGSEAIYDVKTRQLSCRGRKATLKPIRGKVSLQILVDRTSIEIFGNDGRVYMPLGAVAQVNNRSLSLTSQGDPTKVASLEVHELRSAWQE